MFQFANWVLGSETKIFMSTECIKLSGKCLNFMEWLPGDAVNTYFYQNQNDNFDQLCTIDISSIKSILTIPRSALLHSQTFKWHVLNKVFGSSTELELSDAGIQRTNDLQLIQNECWFQKTPTVDQAKPKWILTGLQITCWLYCQNISQPHHLPSSKSGVCKLTVTATFQSFWFSSPLCRSLHLIGQLSSDWALWRV